MQESATRMKLTSKVEEQEQLINALSSELMRFEQSQQKLQQQVDQLQQQKTDNRWEIIPYEMISENNIIKNIYK